MDAIQTINYIIALVFFLCYAYQFLYIPLSLFCPDRRHPPAPEHRFAVLISARNEQCVIGHLIESLCRQNYNPDNLTIFVIADNCTDRTAAVSREAGAVVYERFNREKVGKGYALEELLQHIQEDYPDAPFAGYFVFDADNVLDKNYVSAMNRVFSQGHSIITSYRNTKNFGDNWISAGYALWFLRESRYLNGARMKLGTSCAVSGTGFLFSHEIMKKCGGWPFHLLTEDIEFTVFNVIHGEKIAYCPDAVLYDEQPVTFRQSWRQRMRWAKGYLQVFCKYGLSLLGNMLRGSFSCFDMSMSIMPAIVLTTASIVLNLTSALLGILDGAGYIVTLLSLLQMAANAYLMLLVIGAITMISERKKIHLSPGRKILYTFTFPLFMLTYIPISFCALFCRVQWQPIEHTRSLALEEILPGDRAA